MDSLALYALAQVAQFAVPVNATPQATSSAGTATPTSGGGETFDAVLGYYQAPLVAGRRYLAVMNGLIGNGSVAADDYTIQIRNSGTSSNPTTSSTMVAQSQWYVPAAGTGGRTGIPLAGSFIAPATGLNTFGVSATRIVGTGAFTPVGTRELYVMYLGTV